MSRAVDLTAATSEDVAARFFVERQRAHDKHGSDSLEGEAWDSERMLRVLVEEVGEVAKVLNERDHGHISDHEAQLQLIKELVQCGAMVEAWIVAVEAAR